MKRAFFQICAIVGIVAAMCVLVVGCSSTSSQSSSVDTSKSSEASSTLSSASSFFSNEAASSESSEAVSQSAEFADFWKDSKYANPSELPLDDAFVKAYAGMKGIEDVQFGSLSVSDTAETLTIPFTATFAPFEWEGTEYIPVLSQMEVKLGNGGTVIQTYFSMPGEPEAWVMCVGTDTYKDTPVQVRIRAAINPLGGHDAAYSEWTDWQDVKVELGPKKGEERPVEEVDSHEILAQ